jgi:3-hydroxybutyrate dehydrogenase
MTDDIEPRPFDPDDVLDVTDDDFEGSVAVVTGGGSGIGKSTALALAANGLTVVATDIDEDGLSRTAERAEEFDLEVETVTGDLTEDGDLERIVEEAAELGDLRYVANIAGLQHIDPIEEFPMDQYDFMQSVMLRAPLYLAKLAFPHMREAGGGCVGNMCSVHGHYVTRDKVAYNVSKFGLRGLTQSIAAEGDGEVRAFSISSAYVKTPLVTNQIADTAESRGISEREVVEDVMLGEARTKEMMEPVEVGNLFAFGFSKHARHLNGGDLLWDGGYTLTYE